MLGTMTADASTDRTSAGASEPRVLTLPGLGLPVHVRGSKPRGKTVPLVLHLHGGAFVCADALARACLAQLAADAGCVVASLHYPLAPQHRFPEAVEAGYAALEWLHRQRTRMAGTGAPLVVAGEEAGGNLAAAIAMMARDRGGPPVAAQVLVAPMLDPCAATASLRQKLGTDTVCKWADGWQQYLRGPMDAEHPYAVPGRAQRLAGLPPALVLTGRDDPMRDEALAYAQRLRAAGVAVEEGVLPSTTGWPDSLLAPPSTPCPYGEAVTHYLRDFLHRAMPPP